MPFIQPLRNFAVDKKKVQFRYQDYLSKPSAWKSAMAFAAISAES